MQIVTSISSALLSSDRIYRYDLWRRWRVFCSHHLLGPRGSKGEQIDDAHRAVSPGFCKPHTSTDGRIVVQFIGGGRIEANEHAVGACWVQWQRFEPGFRHCAVRQSSRQSVGPDNDRAIKTYAEGASIVIAAWGKGGSHMGRDRQVLALVPHLYCLKQNKDGSPAHPLYLRGDAEPRPLKQL